MKTFTFRYSPNEPSIGSRMIKAARTGKPDLRPDELVSRSLKGLLTVASESKLELFETILKEKPVSVYALAEKVGKNQSYVLKEVRVLEGLGLIRLHRENEGGRERLRPGGVLFLVEIAA